MPPKYHCLRLVLTLLTCVACAKGRTDSAAAKHEPDVMTIVTGRLVVAATEGMAAAADAAVYLEGFPADSVTSDADGAFTVVVPGEVFINESAELTETSVGWYALHDMEDVKMGVEQQDVTIVENETNELGDVELLKTAEIKGRIMMAGADSHAGIVVEIPGTIFKATTDENGDFVMDGIPAATWSMTATMPGYDAMESEPMTVGAGETHEAGMMGTMAKSE